MVVGARVHRLRLVRAVLGRRAWAAAAGAVRCPALPKRPGAWPLSICGCVPGPPWPDSDRKAGAGAHGRPPCWAHGLCGRLCVPAPRPRHDPRQHGRRDGQVCRMHVPVVRTHAHTHCRVPADSQASKRPRSQTPVRLCLRWTTTSRTPATRHARAPLLHSPIHGPRDTLAARTTSSVPHSPRGGAGAPHRTWPSMQRLKRLRVHRAWTFILPAAASATRHVCRPYVPSPSYPPPRIHSPIRTHMHNQSVRVIRCQC
jgi:hypothetical protein